MRFQVLAVSAALISGICVAYAAAQEPEAEAPAEAPQEAEADTPDDVITVPGELPEVSSDIDMRVYSLRDDPQAQTAPVIDVLGRIPSVSVSPTGQVSLLGSSRVTILIDGEPPSSPDALQTLPAARVDRIEVMTNPPARVTASGTGGVINIVTRRSSVPGLSGTALASVESDGGASASFSPTLTRGPWTFEASLGLRRDFNRRQTTRRRTIVATGDITSQAGRFIVESDAFNASGEATYAPSAAHAFSFGFEGSWSISSEARDQTRTIGDAIGFEPYSTLVRSPGSSRSVRLNGRYEWAGGVEGERLTAAAYTDSWVNEVADDILDDFDALMATDLRVLALERLENDITSVKVDYLRPFGEAVRLELGVSWVRTENLLEAEQETLSGTPPGADFRRSIERDEDLFAAYGALQFAVGGFTFKPGLRIEEQAYTIVAAGVRGSDRDVELFPSVFVEHPLSSGLKLNVSYSRRISRPSFDQLNPAIDYRTSTTAFVGNPDLDPQITDSFEARFSYQSEGRSGSLTLFNRETEGVIANFVERQDDVFVFTTINAGETISRGVDVTWRAPLSQRWRYSVNATALWNDQDVLVDGRLARDTSFTYSGNVQLDYSEGEAGEPGVDQVQLTLRFMGPSQTYQGSAGGFVTADISWRRPLTDRASVVFSGNNLFDSLSLAGRAATPDFVSENESFGFGRTFRIALSYRLGGEE